EVAITIDGRIVDCRLGAAGWTFDGAVGPPSAVRIGQDISVFAGHGFHFTLLDPLHRLGDAAAAGNVIEAPMPGLVKAVFVAAGDQVKTGDRLAVLEAMKMEHVLTAARDGVVAEVLVDQGAQVEPHAALIRLEEAGDDA
ncbi:MAG: DUF2118 domain-containing protein, partial [Rhodobacteraceae bacterium]|nr:DUF2118 domain-containing protein [Paracoccaceae bacterium]